VSEKSWVTRLGWAGILGRRTAFRLATVQLDWLKILVFDSDSIPLWAVLYCRELYRAQTLSDHFKSGQQLSPENRPTGLAARG
jgi:hypothetical protein